MIETHKRQSGILMALMDPPHADEQEFHDWYDQEHIPERVAIPGFQVVQRYVCLEGWPRYMALYDLDHLGLLNEAEYSAIAGPNFSPWSKRIIGNVQGWTRIEAAQIAPTKRLMTGTHGVPLRIAMLRIRGASSSDAAKLAGAAEVLLSDTPGVLQWRLFQAAPETGTDHYLVIELSVPLSLAALDWKKLDLPSGRMDIANMYSRYWRRDS